LEERVSAPIKQAGELSKDLVIKLNNRDLDRSIDDVIEAEVKAGYRIANDSATDTWTIKKDVLHKTRCV
jgi:hypothetical protein